FIVTISEQQSSVDDIQLYVDVEQIVSGIRNHDYVLEEMKVFPNPTADRFFITLNNNEAAEIRIEVSDIAGKVIVEEILIGRTGDVKIPVEMNAYQQGAYFVKINIGNSQKVVKLMKM